MEFDLTIQATVKLDENTQQAANTKAAAVASAVEGFLRGRGDIESFETLSYNLAAVIVPEVPADQAERNAQKKATFVARRGG